MPDLRIIDTAQTDGISELRKLRERILLDRLILDDGPESRVVREIIADVRARGDVAVSEITARVDGAEVSPEAVAVPVEKLAEARDRMEPALLNAVRYAIASVRRFQESLLGACPKPIEEKGRRLSIRTRPVSRVGVCVPGAAAPLPSSAIHSAVPAQVAGVSEIVLVAPPRHNGDIHPTILGVAAELGLTEVYRMGGAQAIAALAIGTERVRSVDKIVGPGSVYVQLAKRALYGVTDIDMFAGPSEVVVIADSSADATFVAADLLAQAEHDPGCSILLTTDRALASNVAKEIDRQLAGLSRREGATRSLKELGAIVIVRDLDEAVELTNDIAPEHLQIETVDAGTLADRIDSAGAIFLGHFTPESAGDYVAGPSHVLPTGGTARFWSGVSALSFLRRTSMIEYTAEALAGDVDAIETLAHAEGLDAHANAVNVRTGKSGPAS